ncbi:MAG: hypothetical protein H6Q90_5450 [Deltaproteobacteria bacterium]|nr:hypothetical protein [Deltaproteobacteria bacterium]
MRTVPRTYPLMLSLLLVAAAACGDNRSAAEHPAECVHPTSGMTITTDTTLCGGTFALAAGTTGAALTIDADNITLRCLDTVIEGAQQFGTVEAPTVGVSIGAHRAVTIRGCTIRSYRYGVTANGATDVSLSSLHLDDNFTDPAADWVQDTVKGGGIRFDGVTGGKVVDSTFARNWNGIELRGGTRDIKVKHNVADHCSNTGATLVDAHDNVFEDNDLSYAVRGALVFPTKWYGVDTKDSAAVIVDAGSTGNAFRRNNMTYGGDGIFVRAVIGACATDNVFADNDTSFSPHNAIESWCDRNQFIGNTASNSHYGIWLGGSDEAVVRDNIVDKNVVDGISIQIAEDRHTVIENNQVTHSGRVGILLTGREYQAWQSLNFWANRLANSSHILVQNNQLSGNRYHDIFVTATTGLVLASNCGEANAEPKIELGRDTVLVTQVGHCGDAADAIAPQVALVSPGRQTAGQAFTLQTSIATPGVPALTSYSWLVQPSGLAFPSLTAPTAVLGKLRDGAAQESITIARPGLYDVDVAVDNGKLASLVHVQVPVVSTGTLAGQTATDWQFVCDSFSTCTTSSDDAADAGLGDSSVHVRTDAPYAFRMVTPATRSLAIAPGTVDYLGFFLRSTNTNGDGWQGNQPIVIVKTTNGETRYVPSALLLSRGLGEWVYVEVPLVGDGGWTRTGPELGTIERVSIVTDTYGFEPIELWIDGLSFYR